MSTKHSGYPKGITKDAKKIHKCATMACRRPPPRMRRSPRKLGNKDEIETGEEEKEDNTKRTKTVMSNYVKNIKKVGVYYSDL